MLKESLKEDSYAKIIIVYKTKENPILIKEMAILMANMMIYMKAGWIGGKSNKILFGLKLKKKGNTKANKSKMQLKFNNNKKMNQNKKLLITITKRDTY